MYSYYSYGLIIHATLPLPALPPAQGLADVVMRAGSLPMPPRDEFEDNRYVRVEAEEVVMAWRDMITVRIRHGRDVVFDPLSNLDEWSVRQCLLGPVLGVLLHQRQLVVLHASAVGIDGQALVFAGWKGQGKSTTAAGLHQRDHVLLADDIVAIEMAEPEKPRLVPGFPQLKLWPDAAAALGLDERKSTLLHPQLMKRAHRVTPVASPGFWPLQGIYVLDQGEAPAVTQLPLPDAFAAVVRHVYPARFLGKAGLPMWHFQHCIALTEATQVYRFRRPASLALLPEALDLLIAHLQDDRTVPG